MTAIKSLSLLDTSELKVREWWVVYHPRVPYYWFTKYLKQGFRHVELAREIRYGPGISEAAWLYVLPSFEMLDVEFTTDSTPPWVKCPASTCQKVTSALPFNKVRSWFDIGPTTCVEIVKAALGINAFWVRTPWQLHQHIEKRNRIIQ